MRLYVISDGAFATHALPASGTVTVGSAPECEVRVEDASVAPHHLRLHLGPQVRIERLGAQAAMVRGEPLAAGSPQDLAAGELVQMGAVQIMLERRRSPAPRRIASQSYFEQRVEEECHRADRNRSVFTVLRVQTSGGAPSEAVEAGLASSTRVVDVIAAYGPSEYELLLCETAPEQAQVVIKRLRQALSRVGPAPRIGLASYPRDGHDSSGLIIAAAPPAGAAGPVVELPEPSLARSPAMQDVQRLVERIAASDISVLVLGETGVGKERIAEALHRHSPRAARPLVRLNCAALSESLLESELFGHERGAFTGAQERKQGLLESAEGGTVFLDEVGDMPLPTQVKLLRVLEERKVRLVGGLKPIAIDVRFVAATNRDLEREIVRGGFRQDLYFRLNGASVLIPPLRERPEEIPGLVARFIAEACARMRRAGVPACTVEALALLRSYPWPGNVRELRSVIERAVVLCDANAISLAHLPTEKMSAHFARRELTPPPVHAGAAAQASPQAARTSAPADSSAPPAAHPAAAVPQALRGRLPRQVREELLAQERQRIVEALAACGGNQTEAAALLGMSRRTLISRIAEYGLPRPRKRSEAGDQD
ncbi:MAG TPA: sigma 54-interacting transcriptional regulator [Myxococcales bacterium]|nr:sigma 54-interacting transcriptional regulator [Myxococcales bacterium]